MKRTALFTFVLFLFSLGFWGNSHGAFMDLFSGMTGRTSNDVKLSADNYSPDMAKALTKLKGKRLYLGTFINKAENTKQFSYPSSEGKFFYVVGHGSVESYFWYCFQKALSSAGLKVSGETQTETSPSLTLTLLFLTDKQIKAEVAVTNGKTFFKKTIEETFEPPKTENRDELAVSAYKFMDKIIMGVMTDSEVLKALGD